MVRVVLKVLLVAYHMDKFLARWRVQIWESHLVQNMKLRYSFLPLDFQMILLRDKWRDLQGCLRRVHQGQWW